MADEPLAESMPAPAGSLAAALATVPDPRRPRGWRPDYPPLPLVALLQLTVAAILCGARSLYAVAQWGQERRADAPELLAALGLPPGRSPCVATLHRVFKVLDVAAFEQALQSWLTATGVAPDDALALDGKTLRGIHGDDIPGVHLVAAYAHAAAILVTQLRTAGKGQELAAVEQVLDQVPVAGRLVTGDALLTQRAVSAQIVARGGDYLLVVKDNQPTLHAELEMAFSPLAAKRPGRHRRPDRPAVASARGAGGRSGLELGNAGAPQSRPRATGSAHAVGLGGPGDHPPSGQFRGGGRAVAARVPDLPGGTAAVPGPTGAGL
jgi:hypothetical protein